MKCLERTEEYMNKLHLSGLDEVMFYIQCEEYYKKSGGFLPNLDEIIGANSAPILIKDLELNSLNSAALKDVLDKYRASSITEANAKINLKYADLEVGIVGLSERCIIDIQHRPLETVEPQSIPSDQNIEELRKKLELRRSHTRTIFEKMVDKLTHKYGINIKVVNDKVLSKNKKLFPIECLGKAAFIMNGDIYLNTLHADIDAPIHELTHLLLGSLVFTNNLLYLEIIQEAPKFRNFSKYQMENPNYTMEMVMEEAFVTEVAKYLSGMESEFDNFSIQLQALVEYHIKRLLDSVLLGHKTVKSIDGLYNKSFNQLIDECMSREFSENHTRNFENAQLHRMLENEKAYLKSKGDLQENCK